jgi:hypothetical protein
MHSTATTETASRSKSFPREGTERKLRGEDSETRDAIVIESFLETLTDVRTDDVKRIFMYVRQGARRRAFKELGERALWETIGFGIEADLEPDPTTLEEPTLRGVWLREAGVGEESVELLATVGDRGALWTLVWKQHPDSDGAQQTRAVRCLQKRRDRLVVRLRDQRREEEACPGL